MRTVGGDQRGVSLIELLVGIVVFILLFLTIDSVFISAHRSSQKAELTAEVDQNARIAIERLTREIRETEATSIRIESGPDGDGPWVAVAFKSARLPSDDSVFCINTTNTTSALYNSACNPTGDDFTPVWQRWIVYTFRTNKQELKRQVQLLNALNIPGIPGSERVVASFIEEFTVFTVPPPPNPLSPPVTFSVTIKAKGTETVQGSPVPPQQILLNGTALIRN